MRRLSLPALVLAVILLPASFALAKLQRDSDRRTLDASLSQEAAQQRDAIDAYFARARAIILLTARNPAFSDFYLQPGSRRSKLRANGPALQKANAALVYLERLYRGAIGEACFIDRGGPENARAVRGIRAPIADLSPDESGNPFFSPTFGLRVGQVYQARPYVSPDTGEWVISNSTPMPGTGHVRAMVHFEVTLESFRRAAAAQSHRFRLAVVDGRTGALVIDGDRPQLKGARLGVPGERRYLALRGRADKAAVVSLGGRRVAFERVRHTVGNANNWLVLAISRRPASSLLTSFGIGSSAMIAIAVLLLAFALLNIRAGALRSEANTDALTGLANRRRFLTRLDRATHEAAKESRPLALLLIDLDHFKELNDALGHQAGDRLLEQIGPRLESAVPNADVLARLGGDEFAILVPAATGANGAIAAARAVRAALEHPFSVSGFSLDIGGSVGIAVFPDHGTDGATLLRRADIAMYQAKGARTGVEVYAAEQDEHTANRIVLAGELRHAIARGELVLHYQPKLDLETDRVVGVEALVRWQHPERGLIPPDTFIPIAEETEIIRPLTEYVLTKALSQCAEWRRAGLHLTVAVNISVANLLDSEFAEGVNRLLESSGVAPSDLKLEITESVIMADPLRALDVLARIGEMGVGLSLDDFGTGYSSLAHLKRMPVDELKIDRSFVMGMQNDGNDAAIVRSAVQLAHSLGLSVVAEGVESAGVQRQLAEMGCQQAQGYHLSKPLPADEFARWLGTRPLEGAPPGPAETLSSPAGVALRGAGVGGSDGP